jgi:hypothetical protein
MKTWVLQCTQAGRITQQHIGHQGAQRHKCFQQRWLQIRLRLALLEYLITEIQKIGFLLRQQQRPGTTNRMFQRFPRRQIHILQANQTRQ